MQIHLDPLGGWSGDMFAAALLDAFPHLWLEVQATVASLDLGAGAQCRLVEHGDGVLTGRRFIVAADSHGSPGHDHHHHHHHHDEPHSHSHDQGGHGHRPWAEIRRHLVASPLSSEVRDHAIGIFGLLADAEAGVHGVRPDEVTFHEVGAVDSIVDIVVAARLIVSLRVTRWTSSPLPLGSGRVRSAHGLLPLPAPATALLLMDLPTIDDGIPGERVTPTGAAIARYLLKGAAPVRGPQPRRLTATGIGFGTRAMPGISNCLRVLAFDETDARGRAALGGGIAHRELGVIAFEVDDQSAEDLTHGLDHLRALAGIHDVIQSPAVGKKGRMATQIQVLVDPVHLDAAVAACFEETTTIGLRYHIVHGAALRRSISEVTVGEHFLRVKTVHRPGGGVTGKTEAGDVAHQRGHAARADLRRAGEAASLAQLRKDDGAQV